MNNSCFRFQLWWYRRLLSVRPAQLGSVLKKLFCIHRRVVRSSNGNAYWIDPVSVFGIKLLEEGLHEPELPKVLQMLLRKGDTFVDVGGNEGYFSMLAASIVADGIVFCIEPQQRLLPIIERNIQLNSAASVSIHNLAFSDTKGQAELFLRPSTNTGASSFTKHWKWGATIQGVQTITLDEFMASQALQRVRLMKIDCEGAEELVIKGATKCLFNQLFDFISVDYHPQIIGTDACDAIHKQIQAASYQLMKFGGVNIYYRSDVAHDLASLANVRRVQSWKD